jgi:hypothetical protein
MNYLNLLTYQNLKKTIMHLSNISIFVNDNQGNLALPSMTGRIQTPDGQTFNVKLWDNVSSNGLKYLKGKVYDPAQEPKKDEKAPSIEVVQAYLNNYLPSSDPKETARKEEQLLALPDTDPVKQFFLNYIKPQRLQQDGY